MTSESPRRGLLHSFCYWSRCAGDTVWVVCSLSCRRQGVRGSQSSARFNPAGTIGEKGRIKIFNDGNRSVRWVWFLGGKRKILSRSGPLLSCFLASGNNPSGKRKSGKRSFWSAKALMSPALFLKCVQECYYSRRPCSRRCLTLLHDSDLDEVPNCTAT
jgi:hypothetical protein